MNVSIVIPVYRASNVLQELTDRIKAVFDSLNLSHEIILVDDSGQRESWEIVKQTVSRREGLLALRLTRNFGQHNAVLCGIRRSKGEFIITMDDDLQHLPEELPKIISELDKGYDVVYAPPTELKHSHARNLTSILAKSAIRRGENGNCSEVSSLRGIKGGVREFLHGFASPNVSIDVLLDWTTSNMTTIRVRHSERLHGKSGYDPARLIRHSMNMMTGFSTTPLKIATTAGFISSGIALTVMIYMAAWRTINGSVIPGFALIICSLAFFSGVQLVALGIIGEYIGRMYNRVSRKPQYLIREEFPGKSREQEN